jgi:hypothetical protein
MSLRMDWKGGAGTKSASTVCAETARYEALWVFSLWSFHEPIAWLQG